MDIQVPRNLAYDDLSGVFGSEHSGLDAYMRVNCKEPKTARRKKRGGSGKGPEQLLKKQKSRKPFWQISPETNQIERCYSPEEEPLLEVDLQDE